MPIEALIEDVAMQHLAQLAAQVPADQAIVEVGTHHAANLCNMAHAAKQSNGAKAFGVDAYGTGDIYRGRPHMLQRYTSADHDTATANIKAQHLVRQAKIIVSTSTQAAQQWDGPAIGLLVIDGEHRHESVLADYRAWQPHLAAGATIAFDDYGGSVGKQVITAVEELVNGGEIDPVTVIGTRLATTRTTPAS